MSFKIQKKESGFVALTSVILISAILLFTITAISLQTIDEAQITSAYEQSRQARTLASGCAEIALLQIRNEPSFAGTHTEAHPEIGSCGYYVFGDIPFKTIQIESVVGQSEYTAKYEIVVSETTPEILIDSWDELADF